MKNLSYYGMALMALILVSCTTDKLASNNLTFPISGYKITTKTIPLNSTSTVFEEVTNINLQGGKPFSETTENFVNGVSQGATVTPQTHFYEGNLLVKRITIASNYTAEFYYDSNQNIIGAKLYQSGGELSGKKYRFIYKPNKIVFFENTTLPYNDPSAIVTKRNILEFDANDNIIKMGFDYNLDGVMDTPTQYSYVNDNLVTITNFDGTVQTFDYSNVIDSQFILNANCFSKKNLNIINSEYRTTINPDFVLNHYSSKNILSSVLLTENFEVLTNNYYKKRTKTFNDSQYQHTVTTDFFFN